MLNWFFRDGQIPGPKTPTPALVAANLPPSEAVNLSQTPPVSSVLHVQKEEVDAFDEFDPRGSNGGKWIFPVLAFYSESKNFFMWSY